MNTWMNTRKSLLALMIVTLITLCGLPAWAQYDDDDDDDDGGLEWELMIGGGGILDAKYLGSDEIEVQPVPFINASLEIGFTEFFLNAEEGAGVSLELSDAVPVALSLGVNMGEGRDRDDANILKGTPNVENDYVVFGGVELDLGMAGELSVEVTYAPITVNYQETERKDIDYTGVLASFDWGHDIGFSRQLMLNVEMGLTWMNDEYAKANYSLVYPTNKLTKTFKAGSGIQDVHLSTQVIYAFTEHFGIGLVGEGAYLLGDASDSPFTKQEFQPFGGAFLVYRF